MLVDDGHPISVRTDRQGLRGGRVQASAGPWRTSGEWWKTAAAPAGATVLGTRAGRAGWNRDEWDVALSDGGLYRIFEDRDERPAGSWGRWWIQWKQRGMGGQRSVDGGVYRIVRGSGISGGGFYRGDPAM